MRKSRAAMTRRATRFASSLFAILVVVACGSSKHARADTPAGVERLTGRTLDARRVREAMQHTVETLDRSVRFEPKMLQVSVGDGAGGTLTAAVGHRVPTADGKGQLVFFFHNDTFINWDASQEAVSILKVEATATGDILVTYANLAPSDPIIGASLPPAKITVRWDGRRMRPSSSLPAGIYGMNDRNANA